MHQNRNGVHFGVAVGVVGCWVGEGCGAVPVLGVVGDGFAGGSAGGGGAAADAGGPDGDAGAEEVLPDGFGRVLAADGCGRTVAVVVAGAGAAGALVMAVAFCEGVSVPAEAGVTAPSELPLASRTVASPQTTTPAADAARIVPRARPPRRRAARLAAWRGGAAEGTPAGRAAAWPAPSPVGASAARPQPGQESAPLRWRWQGVQ
ncbi:hypothetical protein PUR71_27515 [Streptomyces sp. SP17BM10]|uniref:hypothetical protein n=1 Tax=Streptomyces sp. SP17BM10 TaxID=3002530 RepID=UPI002E7A2D04|nr:hypothetical protein [Streptomyces sp. SP17BM10]MEE1786621.1 hypothetical protein [Streptomyces sp. SP17BM10]